jgi:aspartyl-tRNA(Asn)/glutamyl-tRNA(Gln) amidotransferase subunit C
MAALNEEEFARLTRLCRIETTEEEKKKFLHGLRKVLSYIDLLQELDTSGVATCNHVIENSVKAMRDDDIGECLPREEFLANAPSHIGGMIKVPPVMKPSN